MRSRFNTFFFIFSVSADLLFIYIAYILAFWLRTNIPIPFTNALLPEERYTSLEHYYIILFVSHITIFYFFGIYERKWRKYYWDTIKYLFIPSVLSTLILISVYFFKGNIWFPRSVFVLLPILVLLLTNLWRNIFCRFVKQKKSKAIIAGINPDSINLMETFKSAYEDTIELVGVIAFSDHELQKYNDRLSELNIEVLGNVKDIKKIIKSIDFNEIILTPKDTLADLYIDEISRGKGREVSLYAVPSSYEILLGRLKHTIIHDIPMVAITNPSTMEMRIIKRTMDLSLAIVLLTLTAPLFILAAISIKLSSKGPILFKQQRIGRSGKSFIMYKFRSMIENAEHLGGAQLAVENDTRITPFGRFMRSTRIDELPQLFNIILGNMSFVGPRPERKEFIREFIKNISAYRERFRVKPGITGLAQIRGGYHTNARIKLKYDLAYIANFSIWLDLKIILETIKVILTRRGT